MGKEVQLLEMKDSHYKDKPEQLCHLTAEVNTLFWFGLVSIGRLEGLT